MKASKLIAAAIIAAGMASSASAQTVINITGATAFRQAAHQAILDCFDSGSLTYGFNNGNIGNAGRAMFKGTMNSGADQVVVRTSWSGSVAGIRDIVNQANAVTYWAATSATYALLTSGGAANLSPTTETTTTGNKIAFADNAWQNTPYSGDILSGGAVGITAFVPVSNNSTHIVNGSTSISPLQLRRLMSAGKAPLQFITGNSSHAAKRVYWTGRQDTSGTRVIYLTETGTAASAAIQQYRIAPLSSNATTPVTTVQVWPTGDSTNASTIWGADTAGNGGYASGSNLAPVLQRTSTSISELDAAGTTQASGIDAVLITVLSIADANDVQIGGGKALAYNGVYIEPETVATGLSAADKSKIINGAYTLWSYQRLYYRNDITDQVELDFITKLTTEVKKTTNIAGNGLILTEMKVSRSASSDGGSFSGTTML
jgi:hypothetical protein